MSPAQAEGGHVEGEGGGEDNGSQMDHPVLHVQSATIDQGMPWSHARHVMGHMLVM